MRRRSDRFEQFRDRLVFADQCPRTGGSGAGARSGVVVQRQHDDCTAWDHCLEDLGGADAVLTRKRYIQEYDIWQERRCQADRSFAVFSLTHDDEIRLAAEPHAQATPYARLIVDEQDRDRALRRRRLHHPSIVPSSLANDQRSTEVYLCLLAEGGQIDARAWRSVARRYGLAMTASTPAARAA
jgi:hypothetical protein